MNAQRLWHEAETALIKKDWVKARSHYLALLELDPGHVHSLIRLVSVMLQIGSYNDARNYALQASQVATNDDKAIIMLARQLFLFSESRKLSSYLLHNGLKVIRDPMALTEMSVLLNAIGENLHALMFVNKAIALDSKCSAAYYFRGNLHTFSGNRLDAQTDLEHCLSLNPRFSQAYWALSGLCKKEIQAPFDSGLLLNRSQAKSGGNDEIYFSYALHNELHKRGQTAASWQALDYACRAKRKKLAYSHLDSKKLFDSIKAVDWKQLQVSKAAARVSTPVFIVGMHRSGTTLLEQILAGHVEIMDGGESSALLSQLKRATNWPGELNSEFIGYLQNADLSNVDSWFHENAAWKFDSPRFFTEKMPSNFLLLGFILKAIPDAKIIHLVRDPVSTCFSNLRTLFNHECPYSYDQVELADYFCEYRNLMTFWHGEFPGKILDVAYNDLVTNPSLCMNAVFEYLGMKYDGKIPDIQNRNSNVSTASAVSVRDGIKLGQDELWKPYRTHLSPLLARLQENGIRS